MGGLSLAQLIAHPAQASAGSFVRDKSVLLLFQAGGPSQYETFDLKPDGLDSSTVRPALLATSPPRCVAFVSHHMFRSSPSAPSG